MGILLKALTLIFLLVVIVCIWKTAEFFNLIPENHQYRSVVAWDLIVLFVVTIYVGIKIIMI